MKRKISIFIVIGLLVISTGSFADEHNENDIPKVMSCIETSNELDNIE